MINMNRTGGRRRISVGACYDTDHGAFHSSCFAAMDKAQRSVQVTSEVFTSTYRCLSLCQRNGCLFT
jgi:hypothetical protein